MEKRSVSKSRRNDIFETIFVFVDPVSRDDESSWWSDVGALDPPYSFNGASAMGGQGIGNPVLLFPGVPPYLVQARTAGLHRVSI